MSMIALPKHVPLLQGGLFREGPRRVDSRCRGFGVCRVFFVFNGACRVTGIKKTVSDGLHSEVGQPVEKLHKGDETDASK